MNLSSTNTLHPDHTAEYAPLLQYTLCFNPADSATPNSPLVVSGQAPGTSPLEVDTKGFSRVPLEVSTPTVNEANLAGTAVDKVPPIPETTQNHFTKASLTDTDTPHGVDDLPDSFPESPPATMKATSSLKSEANVLRLPYGLDLRDYQQPVWDYFMQDKPGLRGQTIWPRRNGKDLVALNILIAKAIQRVGLYLYIGPLHTQTRQIVWLGGTNEGRKFLDFFPQQLVAAKRNSQMEIDLVNGSMVKAVGSDQYDSLMGLNVMGAIFTEYSLQRPEAWDYIRPMMAANGGWALFNGTPRGMNHMYVMSVMAQKNPKWFYQYLTRDDTGYPTLEAIEEDRRAGMRESLIEQEYYCSWTASTEEAFIPLDIVAPTTKPDAVLSRKAYEHAPRILGCDVAYAVKGDKAVISYRQGRKVHWLRGYQGMDNMAFADEIVRYIKVVRPHAVRIDAGRGEGVISRLYQLGYSHLVEGVHFNGKVYKEGIADMKALMWIRMLEWFKDTNIPDLSGIAEHPETNELDVVEQLVTELTTPNMIRDEKNRVRVEPKSSLKNRGHRSPDFAEALGLTFSEEDENIQTDGALSQELIDLGVTAEMLELAQASKAAESYNPLTYMQDLESGQSYDNNDAFESRYGFN